MFGEKRDHLRKGFFSLWHLSKIRRMCLCLIHVQVRDDTHVPKLAMQYAAYDLYMRCMHPNGIAQQQATRARRQYRGWETTHVSVYG